MKFKRAKCRRCGRTLISSESRLKEIGPLCHEHEQEELISKLRMELAEVRKENTYLRALIDSGLLKEAI